uniref:Hexosyltransferase n=2 Tax=Caenorhabditis tropicalis TaxID=1561998 RepID=A0A1I7U1A0_9PELO
MMDLDRLREGNWNTKWREVANKYLRIHGKTTMSDQDIFNAYIHDYPNEIKTLPCEYNFQLGALTKSEELCDETPLALHFNSQNKTVRKNYVLYNEIRKEIDGIDGSDLRRRRNVQRRSVPPSEAKVRRRDICTAYIPNQQFRILPNSLGRMKKTAKLCLVTQFSKDRMHNFMNNANNWKLPISAAIYGTDLELMEIANAVKLSNRQDIALHMVFKDSKEDDAIYPINYLRNVAMNYSNCEYILMADVDFMIYGDVVSLQDQVRELKDSQVLIIPAFETANENITDVSQFPQTKDQVSKSILDGKVDYQKNYEPYFVIKQADCPLYDQRFGGFGWNKVVHVLKLQMLSMEFIVSPTSFMIHQNHNVSDSLALWRNDIHYQKCLHKLKKIFIVETARKLGMEI